MLRGLFGGWSDSKLNRRCRTQTSGRGNSRGRPLRKRRPMQLLPREGGVGGGGHRPGKGSARAAPLPLVRFPVAGPRRRGTPSSKGNPPRSSRSSDGDSQDKYCARLGGGAHSLELRPPISSPAPYLRQEKTNILPTWNIYWHYTQNLSLPHHKVPGPEVRPLCPISETRS